MWSLVISTVVFFVASFFLKRKLEEMGIPKGMTRGATMFTLALAAAYVAGAAVDWIAGRF